MSPFINFLNQNKSLNSRYKFSRRTGLRLLALGFLQPFSAFGLDVKSVRLWRAPDNTRVVFDLSTPGGYKFSTLSNPKRLIFDFEDKSAMRASLKSLPLADTPIEEIRSGLQKGQRLRIVLQLKQDVDVKHFSLSARGEKNDRLVVDLFDKNTQRPRDPVSIVEPKLNGKRDIVIMIDPGHGGEDPGAVGKKGVYEKNVVLDIGKRLKKIIDKTPGYSANLTRTSDYGVEFRQRREMARSRRADLFLSIHADGFEKRGVHGASVYALNPEGRRSKNEITRYLVQRENEADLIGGFEDISIKKYDDTVAGVLAELSLTDSLKSSLDVGTIVLQSIDTVAKLHSSSVQQADFAVLRSLDVPSILVETGFITNPEEERLLNSSSYQQKMASSIFSGIEQYFYHKPLPGTYVAWAKSNGGKISEHIIKRGESLSVIARRYKVSVTDIMAMNGMSSPKILIGQKLKIPSI